VICVAQRVARVRLRQLKDRSHYIRLSQCERRLRLVSLSCAAPLGGEKANDDDDERRNRQQLAQEPHHQRQQLTAASSAAAAAAVD